MPEASSYRDPARCTVLLVDDQPYTLAALGASLADEFAVLTAANARDAQALLGRSQIDILLTDQCMPGMTGVELLEWALANCPRTQRLLTTVYEDLDAAVDAINRGRVFRYLSKPWRFEEVRGALRAAAQAVLREREREAQAVTDPLTGLPNRRAIEEAARLELRLRERSRGPLTLGVIDADHFREINRCYLHPGGDQALIALAKALAGSLRAADAVGRIGGEEFLLVAPETDYEGAVALAERIRSTVEQSPASYKGQLIRFTVSAGFAVAEAGTETDFDRLKHVASAALGEAKATGRNRSVVRSVSFVEEKDRANYR
ncbi:MAG TPA: diguanylate cyclase [Gemmataceae bacterium]|nr:diguanylate cyclase [Gemmataceae bacterium]